MERYVAIDNVCAWPNLTLMPNGTIIATIWGEPVHASWEGNNECWASEDSGLTWRRRGIPVQHAPGANRLNSAAGLGESGALIVVVAGHAGVPAPSDKSHLIPPVVCRSEDGGYTWRTFGELRGPVGIESPPVPYGDIIRLPDSTLGMACYICGADRPEASYLYRSRDDGRTWEVAARIGEGINETALLVVESGRLLATGRTVGAEGLQLLESTDGGAHWVDRGVVTLPGQHPAHLLWLTDRRILLTYGIRNPGLTGVGFRVSDDGGRNWGQPHLLVEINKEPGPPGEIYPGQAPTWDCGYPSCVQLEDGMVVTAYYARSTPEHTRYHMAVVRWRL